MATAENAEERLRKIIAEQLGVTEDEVVPDASFIDDLNADSLEMVDLIISLEEEFGIQVSDEDTEKFVTYFKVALVTGACLSMPVIVWQALLFVLPALHRNERRWIFVAVPFVTLAFAIGLAFGFFIVIPSAVRFLYGFGGDFVGQLWSIEEYLTFITTLLFWIGLSFETPIVIFVLAK